LPADFDGGRNGKLRSLSVDRRDGQGDRPRGDSEALETAGKVNSLLHKIRILATCKPSGGITPADWQKVMVQFAMAGTPGSGVSGAFQRRSWERWLRNV
jgi:hypothetical protein